jgi:hypothetical protein
MNERPGAGLDRSLNVRAWWLLALALIVGPAIGLYRISTSEAAEETALAAATPTSADHVEGCWRVPEIREWAMSAKHAKYNPKFFMHSMLNAKIEPAAGKCQFEITLTSVDHSAEGAKATWIETAIFEAGDSLPSSVSLRSK